MSRVAPVVPAETDLLCEGCGYTLNGLPDVSNCPECGKPIAESTISAMRQPPAWETDPDKTGFGAFIRTTLAAIFHPTHFYRTLATRGDVSPARRFAFIHWIIASILFAITAFAHTMIFWSAGTRTTFFGLLVSPLGIVVLALIIFIALSGTTYLAARLTVWEAAYRGYRLPLATVLRGMYYHAAHYIPVALIALITVLGYRFLLAMKIIDLSTATTYLYVLCGEVVVGAAYLFHTYWIGMKNMMYANR